MMTPEQRYFFDLTGYLHLEGVLQSEQLRQVQQAAQRYIDTPPDQVPDGMLAKLSPETLELVKVAPIKQIKDIIAQDVVTLS